MGVVAEPRRWEMANRRTSKPALPIRLRDLEPEDLADLEWSGGAEHGRAVAEALQRSFSGHVQVLVAELPNSRLVGCAALDLTPAPAHGVLWMLSVHETVQSLGIGTALIVELERRARATGCRAVRLGVEHDNPRAARLYRRLGYTEVGTTTDSWPVAGGQTYVTVSMVLERRLR